MSDRIVVGSLLGVLFASVAGCGGNNSDTASSSSDSETSLAVVTSASSAPHGYFDNGTYEGIMVEVAERIADELDVELELTNVEFTGLIPAITTGRADLMSAPMFITEERAEQVAFSDPVYGWSDGVVVPRKQFFCPEQFGRFSRKSRGCACRERPV